MSHPTGDSLNLPNGIPPQWDMGKMPLNSLPTKQPPLNGLESSHSSRDSSPVVGLNKIPSHQLPPARNAIPSSQLPPRLGQSPTLLNARAPGLKTPTFTSTPNQSVNDIGSELTSAFSPVTPTRTNNPVKSAFTPTSSFKNPPNVAAVNPPQNSAPTNLVNAANSVPVQPNVAVPTTTNQTNNFQFNNQPPSLINNQTMQSKPFSQNQNNAQHKPQNLSANTTNQPPSQNPLLPNYSQQSRPMQNPPPQMQNNQHLQNPSLPNPTQSLPPMPQPQQQQQYKPPQIQNQTQSQSMYNFQQPPPPLSNGPPLPQQQNQQQRQPLYNHPKLSEVPLSQPQARNNNMNSSPYGAPPPQPNAPMQPPQNNFSAPPPMSQQHQVPTSTGPARSTVFSNRYPVAAAQPKLSAANTQQPYVNQPAQPQNNQQYQSQNAYNQNYSQQSAAMNNYNQKGLTQQFANMSVVQSGFNRMWGAENFDLLQCPNILPAEKIKPPQIGLGQDFLDAANCSPDICRSTMTKIPESNSLLQKSRLPLGILIHPFKDLNHLPVIQCSTIVRCRACRTYINPFVFFVDSKRWKCNLCYRINELPEEFQYDPVSKSYGDPSRRPEVKSSTIEYIAPSEYMLRPPQPAVYLFLLDVSRLAVESGYLHTICDVLLSHLETLPGDARTQIGFLTFDSALHFYALGEGFNQPHEMTVLDIDDVFLPCPDNLLVNLKERMELVKDLLTQLPNRYANNFDTGSALGAALQAAYKMMGATGGRVTVFQACLPTLGPGSLTPREDPNQRAGADTPHLNPATDFYKRLALDCSGQQIAVDLFLVNSQYIDLATISGISRFSGGCIYHFPLFKVSRTVQAEGLERCFKRYLTRKIGFEAVMRIRCTRGLSIHTFHGNFFVRSTDLLSLPNINPDAGFGLQVAIEENLSDLQNVSFQAAVLYTSSKGERRIRVHTLCLPIVANLSEVLNSADQQCIIGLLAKMAVDRSLQASLSDARDAFINVAIDILASYKLTLNMGSSPTGLLTPNSLRVLPLYISALLKHQAFRTGSSTRLDDRICSMCDMKTLPLPQLIQQIYPDLYPIHNLEECSTEVNLEGIVIPQPPRLQLTARSVDSSGAYLLDKGQHMIIMVCPTVSPVFLRESLGVPDYNSIADQFYELPALETPQNHALHHFINSLNDEKPYVATLQVIRENSQNRSIFIENLIEDRMETALSYHEFLQHLKTQVK